MPHPPKAPTVSIPLRLAAVVVALLSLLATGGLVLGGSTQLQRPDNLFPVPALFAPATLCLAIGIALAATLESMARMFAARSEVPDMTAPLGRVSNAIATLHESLPQMLLDVQPAPPMVEVRPAIQPEIEEQLAKMVKLLEEMKELSMLDDAQRQARRQQVMSRRKISRLEEAARLIHHRSWAEADALLHLLESLHPGDPDVLARRNELDDSRVLTQADDWEKLTRHTDDLMALSQYDQATAALAQFLEEYPTHTDAIRLSQRVAHEQGIYLEQSAIRLYEEIKSAVEARQWRLSLDSTQKFLDRFPEHPRANKIRQQVRVIQRNAEIEERHEQEDRIRDLVKNQQFADAVELSEDLLRRFPDSPQAASLEALIPKWREKAVVNDPQDVVV